MLQPIICDSLLILDLTCNTKHCDLVISNDLELRVFACNCTTLKISPSRHDILLTKDWDDKQYTILNGTVLFKNQTVTLSAKYCRIDKKNHSIESGDLVKIGEHLSNHLVFEFKKGETQLLPENFRDIELIP